MRRQKAGEELAVERTVLEPDSIKLTVRNDGPDAVTMRTGFVGTCSSGDVCVMPSIVGRPTNYPEVMRRPVRGAS